MVEQRGGRIVFGGRVVRLAGEQGGDALAVEDAQFERSRGDGLDAAGVEPAIRAQNAQTGSKPLLGMLSAGEDSADQGLGVGPDLAGPAAKPIRRPLGVMPMGTGHVIGVRAVLAAHVAALMDRNTLSTMEHLDDALGDADLDLGANEGVRDRVQKVVDLDVIIEIDARSPPFRELPILRWQAIEGGAFDLLEQLAPADAQMAHRAFVHALHDELDRLVAFGQREERQRAQSPEDIGLSESDSGFDFCFISWLTRPRRKDSYRIMRGHRTIGSVDLWIVERGFVDAALQIIGDQQFGRTVEEAEHANMCTGPIRQLLRPGSLGVSQVRSAEHSNKYLGLVNIARLGINNRDPLPRVVHECLLAGDMMLTHHWAQPSLKPTQQITEAAIPVTLLVDLSIFLPQDHHRDPRPLHLARQRRPIRLGPATLAGRDPSAPEQPLFQDFVGDIVRHRPS